MSEVLRTAEAPMRGVLRIFIGQLDKAVAELERGTSDDAIHEIRKELKRARATLRLLREPLGTVAYRRENTILRNTARPMTPLRDGQVLLEAFNTLLGTVRLPKRATASNDIHRMLLRERSVAHSQWQARAKTSDTNALRAVRVRMQGVNQARLDRARLSVGVERAYKKARKTYVRAKRDPSDDRLHEWRKQVKYFLHQLQVAQPLEPKRIVKSVNKAHKLADHLGVDHDLALLQQKILRNLKACTACDRIALKAISAQLKRRRSSLQRKSYRLADKLYSNAPRRVGKRFEGYSAAWQRLAN